MAKKYLVETIVNRKTGLLVAMCAELPGLYVHGRNQDELDERIPVAIAELLRAAGEHVHQVIRVDDEDDLPPAFQATKAEYAAEACAA